MEESNESKMAGIRGISIEKDTKAKIQLGKNGPTISIEPREGTESGMAAFVDEEIKGEKRFTVYDLKPGENYVGRDDTNDIVIKVPTVSRKHLLINVGDHSYGIMDSGSTNGTFLIDDKEDEDSSSK